MTTAEDNKRLVAEAFRPWEEGDSRPFFDLIADDVAWTVIGSTPASGKFASKQAVIDQAFGPLLERLDGPLKTSLVDIAGEGTRDKVFLRFTAPASPRPACTTSRTTAGRWLCATAVSLRSSPTSTPTCLVRVFS